VTGRREPRRKLLLDAQAVARSGPRAGEATDVLIHNISATGLLFESAAELAPGEAIEIELPESGPVVAGIVWASGRLYGCQFEAPVSSADLSAAALRSAVEQEVELVRAPVPEEAFASRLQRLRKARGMTLAEVAAELDVSKPTVWAWEKGRARPLDDRIDDLAQALGVPSSDLVTGHDSEALQGLIARCRDEIGRACGASPEKVRIFVEL
jgi:transcriptional regulator with XRE-family HTH domain